jgi:hypothetical protein
MPKNPCIYTIKDKNGKTIEKTFDEMRQHILDNYDNYKNILEDATKKSSTTSVDVGEQATNGEKMGEGNAKGQATTKESEPNTSNEKEKLGSIYTEQPPFVLKVSELEKIKSEYGMEDFEKDTISNLQAHKNAENTIKEWKEKGTYDKGIENIIAKSKGGFISDAEQNILAQHIADLRVTEKSIKDVTSKEFENVVGKLKEAAQAGRKIREEAGRTLSRQLLVQGEPKSAAEYIVREMENTGIAEFTDAEKKSLAAEFTEMQEIKQKLAESEAERLRLEKELAAKDFVKKVIKNTKKTHSDFVAERKSLKEELLAAKEKHEKWLKDNGISTAGASPFTLTTDMAKIIGKMVKSHAEETVLKFDELVNRVFDEAKEILDGISRKDIIDVMAGVYEEKKATRNEKAAALRDLKTEAKLLNELENLRLGKVLNKSTERIQKSARIKELESKVSEIRKRNKDKEDIEKQDWQRLDEKKARLRNEINKLQEDIKNGNFAKEEPKPPVILDKEGKLLQDRLMHLKAQQEMRRQKADYEALSKWDKASDKLWQVLGLRRLVNAAIDFSIPFRQANTITMNPFKAKTTLKSFYNMFNLSFSPEKFKRFQYQLEKSNVGELFEHFGGVLSNPLELKMDKRDEQFTNNIISTIHQKIEDSDNKNLKKVAKIADKAWFSERASAAFLNTVRIEEFKNGSKELLREGITPDNSPEHYKALVKWIMNTTGRGNMLKVLEDSHAGRIVANRTYFGARLMAAKINMLNPVTYKNLPKEVRAKAIKDMLGYTSSLALTGLGVIAAGGQVSLNPDEPDFMQARFGDKVYDLTGGSVAYVRTFLRFITAMTKQAKNFGSKDANSYSRFAGSSISKTFVTNKLSPNTAYIYHTLGAMGFPFAAKSAKYDEGGHLQPYDPYEIAKVYPLYVDGTIKAFEEGGVSDALMVLIPDIFGIGTQQYEKKNKRQKSSSTFNP